MLIWLGKRYMVVKLLLWRKEVETRGCGTIVSRECGLGRGFRVVWRDLLDRIALGGVIATLVSPSFGFLLSFVLRLVNRIQIISKVHSF